MVVPEMIGEAISPLLQDDSMQVVNLMSKIDSVTEFEDPNEVKVVVNHESNAMYFSREPIPSRKKGVKHVPMLKQVCIIPFRREYLLHFNAMQETELERIESVDMMRIVESGGIVHMVMTEHDSFSVDTKEDLKNVEQHMAEDVLMGSYSAA
jgi:3-deoxy-manno-octulosonate cytidylyltransferase (CMP-KDO synthetase)